MGTPLSCPKCGSLGGWNLISSKRTGFSMSKAAAGTVLRGPLTGLLAGAIGDLKKKYACRNCGYTIER